MAYNLGSVAFAAYNHLNDIPADISGALPSFADEARLEVQTFTQESISDTGAIADKHVVTLINLTCAYALSRMAQVGVDFDYTLGEFSVSKGNSSNYDKRIDFFLQRANQNLMRNAPSQFGQAFY